MMRKKIVIYAEGGLNLGMGNIYRSISLIKAFIKVSNDVYVKFITSSPDYIVAKIEENGFDCVKTDQVEKSIINEKPDLLIIDFLNVDDQMVNQIKTKCGCKVAIIGNLNKANQYADLVVNAIIGTNFINSQSEDKYGTVYLKGPKYLVLRDEFEQVRDHYKYDANLKKVVLLFGGTDAQNHTCSAIKQLLGKFQITVIVGSGFEYIEELKRYQDDITIHQNINNVSEVLLKNDFLITSPGTALFEAFCVGIPAISLFQNKSQQDVFGDFVTTTNINQIELEQQMIKTYESYTQYKQEIDALQIGLGKADIIDNLLKLI